ncbi:cobalamin-independent methionine synthase II family protein [Steroidobacter sp. S1-65]|uniref:Cobalamin-independent methionine synthase II family protein n=1 Tax=Steroidobacter gossypii TaxID=2805490 RepID=A0ABS1X191_9GAMM|nr:cobalamin-independent methionine synthase II family protein [Steroidobacter gossypii]
METGRDRILVTLVGSLPRSQAVTDVLFARERGESLDEAAAHATIADAVKDAVRRQVASGVDVVSDGEMSKISYATYIKNRLTGFAGDTPREPGQDLVEFPRILKRLADTGATAKYTRPRCVAEIRVNDLQPAQTDVDNLKAALADSTALEGFLNAASPGVIALFQPNDYYSTQDAYVEAVAEAMRAEYELITRAGLLVQIDAPDLAMGRHTMYRHDTVNDFLNSAARHIEVLNHALRNVPAERARMHVCWGNYEGPHHHDVPLEQLLPVVVKAKVQALLIEGANPRHEHEWAVFRDARLPEDKVLIPGVISTTTNYIEHPLLVAERLCRYADVVGRDRVMAGTDCGFGTFAGFGPVDPDVAYLKLKSLAEGAAIASDRLWGRR